MTRAKGLDKHLRRMKALAGQEMIRVAGQIVYEGADTIKAEAQNLISTGSVSGAGHVASRPGEPPNFDTGFLSGAIVTLETGPLSAEVGALAPYSSALEFGTSKMAARPFLRPARDRTKAKIQKRFVDQMNRLNRKLGA